MNFMKPSAERLDHMSNQHDDLIRFIWGHSIATIQPMVK